MAAKSSTIVRIVEWGNLPPAPAPVAVTSAPSLPKGSKGSSGGGVVISSASIRPWSSSLPLGRLLGPRAWRFSHCSPTMGTLPLDAGGSLSPRESEVRDEGWSLMDSSDEDSPLLKAIGDSTNSQYRGPQVTLSQYTYLHSLLAGFCSM